jgi:hypothetical protein
MVRCGSPGRLATGRSPLVADRLRVVPRFAVISDRLLRSIVHVKPTAEELNCG